MQALIVGNFLSGATGTRSVCEDLSQWLKLRGWDVETASSRLRKTARLADMLSAAWRARRNPGVAQVDVFSGDAFFWAEAVCRVLRATKRPYVLTLHGGNLPEFSRKHSRRVQRLLSSAAAVTAPSEHMANQFRDMRPDIRLLPNPLDIDRYAFRPRPAPRPRLMWLRAFHSMYNPVAAVCVLRALSEEFPGATLKMIGPDRGDGSLEATRRAATALGVAARLSIEPGISHDHVPAALARGEIFLNTTRCESFGVSVMEAAALGLCIVSTSAGALSSVWTRGHDALLAPPGDARKMAEAVRRVLTETGMAERLSHNARARAEQHDYRLIVPRWETLLRQVAQGAP